MVNGAVWSGGLRRSPPQASITDFIMLSWWKEGSGHVPSVLFIPHALTMMDTPSASKGQCGNSSQGHMHPGLLCGDSNLHILISRNIPVRLQAVLPSVLYLKLL